MDRILALVVVLMILGTYSAANAQAPYAASSQLPESVLQGMPTEAGKEQIEVNELPKAVKKALKHQDLKHWNISEVYLVRGTVQQPDPKPVYEVYLTNEEKKKSVARFYRNGNAVTGKR